MMQYGERVGIRLFQRQHHVYRTVKSASLSFSDYTVFTLTHPNSEPETRNVYHNDSPVQFVAAAGDVWLNQTFVLVQPQTPRRLATHSNMYHLKVVGDSKTAQYVVAQRDGTFVLSSALASAFVIDRADNLLCRLGVARDPIIPVTMRAGFTCCSEQEPVNTTATASWTVARSVRLSVHVFVWLSVTASLVIMPWLNGKAVWKTRPGKRMMVLWFVLSMLAALVFIPTLHPFTVLYIVEIVVWALALYVSAFLLSRVSKEARAAYKTCSPVTDNVNFYGGVDFTTSTIYLLPYCSEITTFSLFKSWAYENVPALPPHVAKKFKDAKVTLNSSFSNGMVTGDENKGYLDMSTEPNPEKFLDHVRDENNIGNDTHIVVVSHSHFMTALYKHLRPGEDKTRFENLDILRIEYFETDREKPSVYRIRQTDFLNDLAFCKLKHKEHKGSTIIKIVTIVRHCKACHNTVHTAFKPAIVMLGQSGYTSYSSCVWDTLRESQAGHYFRLYFEETTQFQDIKFCSSVIPRAVMTAATIATWKNASGDEDDFNRIAKDFKQATVPIIEEILAFQQIYNKMDNISAAKKWPVHVLYNLFKDEALKNEQNKIEDMTQYMTQYMDKGNFNELQNAMQERVSRFDRNYSGYVKKYQSYFDWLKEVL